MNKNIYKFNRDNLLDKIKDNSIVILFAGKAIQKTGDQTYPFTPNRNFYYLTGIKEEDHILVMTKINGVKSSKLYIKDIDLEMEKWVGKSIRKEEAEEIAAVDEVKFKSQFDGDIHGMITMKEEINLYLDLERREQALYNTFALVLSRRLRKDYPSVKIESLYAMVLRQRMIKSKEEVALIKESIETTRRAIYNVMSHAKEHSEESIANAYHDFVLISEKKINSFDPIIAAGHNGTTLHYESNNSPIEPNTLMLMDVGCYTNHYSSDISRTFPVSGKFTKRQKEVYEVVLDCNKRCIEHAKAGMSWKELNDFAKRILANGCKKLGLIKEDSELEKYYFHSIGHSLGLDVHDPSIDNLGILEGMVITIEPGLYIPEESIGIRIEDDIQITKDKAVVLSSSIIKEVADIEEMMK